MDGRKGRAPHFNSARDRSGTRLGAAAHAGVVGEGEGASATHSSRHSTNCYPKRYPHHIGGGVSFEHVLEKFGSPTWTRTRDHSINSRMLYQLSYRGMWGGV